LLVKTYLKSDHFKWVRITFTLLNVDLTVPSGEGICDGRNPIAGSAECHMLLDVDELLCDARRLSAADAFRSDAIDQASLHIFSGVQLA
jgi:hypothetical protein